MEQHLQADRRVDQGCAEELSAIGIPNSDTAADTAEVLENLECPRETYLVLDSFELSGLPEPERFLWLLSKHGGEKLHIVAVTRELAVSPMLSNHRIYRMNAEDFMFRAEDTAAYFHQAGLDVMPGQTLAAHQAAGGWVLALHMQVMAYVKNGSFSTAGATQLIHQVVWDGLLEAERQLFLSVSILPRFTLAQAAELSGMDGALTEALLERQSAFVHFDEETHSFYLHTVFAAFLREQFQLLPEERQKAIYLAGGDLASPLGRPAQYPALLLLLRRLGTAAGHAFDQLRAGGRDRRVHPAHDPGRDGAYALRAQGKISGVHGAAGLHPVFPA